MFSYTKKEIVILAEKLNVQKQTLERVLRLIDILEFINEDEYLKGKLLLKGGTAINLTFYDFLRKCFIFYLLLSSEDKIDIKLLFDECKIRMISFIGNRVPQYLTSTLKLNEEFDIRSAVDNINLLLDEFSENICDNEIAFIKDFPNTSLQLFCDPIIDEKIRLHPMIKWKMSLVKDKD